MKRPQVKISGRRGHSRWLMLTCCVPMLAIVGLLLRTGGGPGFLVVALICAAMMALMMAGMSPGGGAKR